MSQLLKCIFLLIFLCSVPVHSWDNEELEIFDLVEEIKDNFYGILGVNQDATLQEIKRAFRNLSIILHPDKSDAEDANVQFRNLVSVYEVLKDSGKREKYNKVLKDGLPNWKSALYYYRHVRKVGLMEGSLILFVIITIGQYLVSWGAYLEKKFTAEQIIGSKLKRLQKKNKTTMNMEEILKEIPAPSIFNTLPFQIPLFFWYLPRNIKEIVSSLIQYNNEQKARRQREQEEAEEQKILEEEYWKEKENKSARKRKPLFVAPEKTDEELSGYSNPALKSESVNIATKTPISGGIWTDEDLVELTRLIKKYPGGTTDRWELIADALFRNVSEVTHMAAKLKENGYRIQSQGDSVAESLANMPKPKVKTKKTDQILVPEATWSQEQQQALEAAIVKYPKTASSDRWQKISSSVPGKSREECLVRYKYLVELVKMQKQQQQEEIRKQTEGSNKTDDDKMEADEQSHEENSNSKPAENIENQKSKKQPKTKIETSSKDDLKKLEVEEDIGSSSATTKGKKKNLRKEKKKKMEFSSDEDSDQYDNDECDKIG